MKKAPRFSQKALNPAIQHHCIIRRFPTFKAESLRGGAAVWVGRLQPRDISAAYKVRISYKVWTAPKVSVLEPRLHPEAPHRYEDGSLCLYWPREWFWQPDVVMAETIIPWTALWLFYYELWLDTDEWLGPAAPHQTRKGERKT